MNDALTLKVVTPNEVFYEGQVQHVMAPGALGYLGILKNHAPLITTLEKGKLTFRDNTGKTTVLEIGAGFLEVLKNRVLVLTDQVQGAIA